jgi:ABC-type branched-subunit amino acid transport system permease subunit
VINSVAIPLLFVIAILTIIITGGSGNLIPLLIGGIVGSVVFIAFRKIIQKIEADYKRASKPLIEKGIELKNKIVELKKVVEY